MNKNEWTPADLLHLSGSYWSACALHAGVKLDIFTQLAERELNAAELALLLKSDPRGLAMLLNALTSLGLLSKRAEIYSATPFAAKHLARTSQLYLGHIIQHHHHLMAGWTHLDEAVVSGQPFHERISRADDETTRESFEMGMFNLAMQLAPLIVPNVNLAGRRRLLDLGGGPGTYAINFCRQYPDLSAVVYDLPSTRPFAEATIARFDLTDRIDFEEGDFIAEDIEGRFDVAWLSHILHGEGPDGCAILLKRAVSALEPGGLILVQEFILDDTMDGPLFPALFSLNMLLGTTSGQAYSQGELMEMLEAAGARNLTRLSLDLPNGAGVISGVV